MLRETARSSAGSSTVLVNFVFSALVTFVTWSQMTSASPLISSEVEAMIYLRHYGYMDYSTQNSASLISGETVQSAIKDFQRFAGLSETGVLDNTTLTMMNMPRCGVRDKVGHSGSARRRKRYALQGSKWRVTNISYRISKYPSRIKDRQKVEKEISRAFKVWSDVTPLQFIETKQKNSRVHIDVRFEANEHGDGEPFDGPGRTLAHAFFPQYGGDAHFDDEEKWTIDQYSGTNLFQVAAHEFGHSLGLSHSDVRSSLMAPFYRGYDPSFTLDEDDVSGIQALYGRQKKKPATQTPETKPRNTPDIEGSPDLCQDSAIDAATRTEDGRTYVFKGEYYWEITKNGIADGYPRKISDDWSGHPGNIDAALTWSNGKTFFFQKDKYWRFRNKKMDSGYPKLMSVGFDGIPDSVDAAFTWSGNGKTYFFKGSNYWRFDSRSEPPVSARYPQPISNWAGLPDNIDAALQWENQRTYFFKGKSYYRFNDRSFSVDTGNPAYPRTTSIWWFDCQSQSDTSSSLKSADIPPIYIGLADLKHNENQITSTTEDYGGDSQVVDGSENLDVEDLDTAEDDKHQRIGKPHLNTFENNTASTIDFTVVLVVALTAVAKFVL